MVNIALSNEYNDSADINDDGTINIFDIIMVVNMLVGDIQ